MNEQLPAPLVPAEVDCSDLDGFMLNVERLMASEFVAVSTHEEIAAAIFLWCRAWKQRPAASLPDDDRICAAFARLSLARFKKIKEAVLHGFIKCSDGRLYHRFLAKEAVRAYERKSAFRHKRETDAERLRKWRGSHKETHVETPEETTDETNFETRFVAEGQGQGQGHIDSSPSVSPPFPDQPTAPASPTPPKEPAHDRATRGSRIPPDWQPHADDRAFAERLGLDPDGVAEQFRDYWRSQPGQRGVKLDWPATWRNWCRREGGNGKNHACPGPARPQAGGVVAAVRDLLAEAG